MELDSLAMWDRQLYELTNTHAIALTFTPMKPIGVFHELNAQPAACSFWKLAAEERAFYTEASDHFGCAVGAYTLGAELPEAKAAELTELTSTMINLSYIKAEDVAEISHRTDPLHFVIYAPLHLSPLHPDVVLVRGNAQQLMLLTEAARAAGFLKNSPAMGRPACAMLPLSLASGQVVLSLGCIGNRVYTDLGSHEGYLAIPGNALASVCSGLKTISQANQVLEQFHNQRRSQSAECITTT
jgi:uncharacterized protein (DUF169 family)